MTKKILGFNPADFKASWFELERTCDSMFTANKNGVEKIISPADGKSEFVCFKNKVLCHVKSSMGYDAYYPLYAAEPKGKIKAFLMDLDGTSVRSEEFWIWIIEQSIASLLENRAFQLEEADLPFVSGHSVSEHLQYCIDKYCPEKTVEEARSYYFEHTRREMKAIMDGHGRENAFIPTPGLKEFLYELKAKGIKIGLVTSGLYEKAYPEILSAFRTLGMGDPAEFYDAIITAGFPLQKGSAGTLGELSPKPHPWLYAETARVGLGIDFKDRNSVLGIEDSSAGVVSVRLAGFASIGFAGGNIEQGGTKELCCSFDNSFEDVLKTINDIEMK